uniref:Uncharacterized protein n=1 Tax=Rhizophora mucronata TaxID=61149 RepID=A0A2P2L3S6_RHIMU
MQLKNIKKISSGQKFLAADKIYKQLHATPTKCSYVSSSKQYIYIEKKKKKE